jgi:hypothetical protein
MLPPVPQKNGHPEPLYSSDSCFLSITPQTEAPMGETIYSDEPISAVIVPAAAPIEQEPAVILMICS